MGRSKGTKETQGINGDATSLGKQLDAVLVATSGSDLPTCPYERHRTLGLDWRNVGGRTVCGLCHPPARGLEVERVPYAG